MIRLDSTRSLQALLGGAVATTELPITVSYSDKTTDTYNGAAQLATTTGVTPVIIAAAPAAGVTRDIDYISVRNVDTAPGTITIRYSTPHIVVTVLLAVGDHMVFVHGDGWRVFDAGGSLKTVLAMDHGTLTGLGDDDHPQYVLHTEVDDVPVNGATTDPISSNWAFDHEAAADPHPQYLTPAEGNAAYDALGAAAAAVAAHEGAVDPHTQYLTAAEGDALFLTPAEGNAAYAPISEPIAAAHIIDAADAHDASAISILDAADDFTATNVEDALAELQSDAEADAQALADHIADTTNVHDHGSLGGLADDDHTQYALLAGRAGGQTLIGGTAAGEDLTLQATSSATDGDIIFKSDGSTERMRLDADGDLNIGSTNLFGGRIESFQTAVGHQFIGQLYSADANGASIAMVKSRGATPGTFTAVQSGDLLGRLAVFGADGTTVQQAAGINFSADGTPSSGVMPGRIAFLTTPPASATPIERVRIVSSGEVLIGHSAVLSGPAGQTMQLQVAGSGFEFTGLGLFNFDSDSPTVGPILDFSHSRNNTIGSHTVVANSDFLGIIRFNGSDGDEFLVAAQIVCKVDGTPGNQDMPGRLEFSTTADGDANPTLRLTIGSTGLATFAGDLTATRANVGGIVQATISNTDNTNATSRAELLISTGGSSSGDAQVHFLSASEFEWVMGLDNSDSNAFVIAGSSSALGTNNRLHITTGGVVTLSNLAGTGSRTVVADANGVLSAP